MFPEPLDQFYRIKISWGQYKYLRTKDLNYFQKKQNYVTGSFQLLDTTDTDEIHKNISSQRTVVSFQSQNLKKEKDGLKEFLETKMKKSNILMLVRYYLKKEK